MKISKVEIRQLIEKGADMNALYRKLTKKGKTDKQGNPIVAPQPFIDGLTKLFGGDPIAIVNAEVAARNEKAAAKAKAKADAKAARAANKTPAIKISKMAVRNAVRNGAADMASLHAAIGGDAALEAFSAAVKKAYGDADPFIVKPLKAKGSTASKEPQTTPYRKGTIYQSIVDLCISGGMNGSHEDKVKLALIEKGICPDLDSATAALGVVRNPAQFSNRGKTACANIGKGKTKEGRASGQHKIVEISVLSLTPTLPDRFGNMTSGKRGRKPKTAAPAIEPQTSAAGEGEPQTEPQTSETPAQT